MDSIVALIILGLAALAVFAIAFYSDPDSRQREGPSSTRPRVEDRQQAV